MLALLKNDHFREAAVRIRVAPVLALCATFLYTVLVSSRRDGRVSRAAGTPFPAADTTFKAAPFLDRASLNVRFCPNSETTPHTASHNPDLQTLVNAVQKSGEVPFQVRLSEDLATKVKVFCAQNKLSHKQVVTEALLAYLDGK